MASRKSIYTAEYRVFLSLLRAAREKAGMSQEEMAKRVGMTQSMLSKCERGERRLDIIEARRFCVSLGVGLPTFSLQLEAEIQKLDAESATRKP